MSKPVPADTTAERHAIDELAESFVARLRAGERPSVDEYARRYPELADQVRELLPALVLLEQHGSAGGTTRSLSGNGGAAPIPSEIGDFVVVREIGRGGMGVVYEAVQQSLGRHVALKVLAAPAFLSPTHLERFRLEARAAARLHHSHIVPVFGVGEHEGLHYYAMQFIPGQSLDLVIEELRRIRGLSHDASATAPFGVAETRVVADGLLSGEFASAATVADGGPNSPAPGDQRAETSKHSAASAPSEFSSSGGRGFYQSVTRVGLQVAEALAYAHGEGILHRDVKPSNLLLDAKGNVWITDFGLAKDEAAEGLTRTGDFVGTLRYMAPERIDGWSDPRSDIYSLGATLYELLTLRPMFEHASRGKLVEQIFYDAPSAPSKLDRSVPADLETIILKAVAKEPAQRYRTATDMADDLRRFLQDRPIHARRSTAREHLARWIRRNPLAATMAGVAATLALVSAVILAVSAVRLRRESAALAVALDQKTSALSTAHDAINQMLTRTANEALFDAPRLHPVRVALLEDALKFYEDLAAKPGADPVLRHEIASVLQTKSGLERELGQYDAANVSLERSIALLASLTPTDPNPPQYREQLALAEQELALTWLLAPDQFGKDDGDIERQFRRAFRTFDDVERQWPDRIQPSTLSTRYLAHYAFRRGDVVEAERMWRSSIDDGEAYVAEHPEDLIQAHEVAWACAGLYDLLSELPTPRFDDAEQALHRGLRPLERQLAEQPDSSGLDVATALRFRLGQCYAHQGRAAEAAEALATAIRDMKSLCEAFPWNDLYWGNLVWFHQEMLISLRQVDSTDRAQELLVNYGDWLMRCTNSLPADDVPQEKLRQAQENLVPLLRAAGLDREANELADAMRGAPITAPPPEVH